MKSLSRFFILWLVVGFAWQISLASAAAADETLSGSGPSARRILFLGDSITYGGQYVEYVEVFLRLQYPEWRGELLNLGLPSETVSGLSEPGHADGAFPRPDLHERLNRVLDQTQPDLVIACYGMNDGIYLPLSEDRFESYQKGIQFLEEQVKAKGAKLILLTPPTFDPVARNSQGPAPFNYNEVLTDYSTWLLSRRTRGWTVLDIHGPMDQFLMEQRRTNPEYRLAGDGVHPNEVGHWLMARPLLAHFGAPPSITEATSVKPLLDAFPNGPAVLKQVQERQRLLKDAWLTATGHKRPGMSRGQPLDEAKRKAHLLEQQIYALSAPASASSQATPTFQAAKPVWPAGRELEKSLTVGFRATFTAPAHTDIRLRATGSTLYRVYLNGRYLGYGPARGPHDFYRVDEWDLAGQVRPGTNLVAFEVAGYNVNSYYVLDQPSFLQAEITARGEVLAATGIGNGFEAGILPERVQKVQRYSFQRPFSEVYRLRPNYDLWRRDPSASWTPLPCAKQPAKALLPRRVAFPAFALRQPSWRVANGRMETGIKAEPLWKDRSLTAIGPKLGGYPESDLETIPSIELQTMRSASRQDVNQPYDPAHPIQITASGYEIADLGCNLTGFIGARVHCPEKIRLWISFDEVLTQGEVDFKRLGCVNVVVYDLSPGTYEFETFEPYTLRYLKLMALEGACQVERLWLREYADNSHERATFAASDERFNRLFAAGRETFRQNSLDLFMDCPSRERAGWLCDSFFTARTALDLCGDTRIEQSFLENYALPTAFKHLPPGMLPMCYPADHNDGVFIPNWSLWFVVQLEEYLHRSGDQRLIQALRPRVFKLLDYFTKFRNENGLLEKLESWVFIEWSKANDFVQDVNFPSNMLYAKALEVAGRLYSQSELIREADRLREVIRQQSFDGEFFVDNAQRQDGTLQVTRNRTEVCQYFAFFFGVATPESHPKLWQTLIRDFGPQRKQTKAFAEVHPANAFIGNVLRLELLSRYGRCQQLLDESLAYQLYMADLTGTLWENDGAYASCNHGFASHGGVHLLYRDVLGLYDLNPVNKMVHLRFTDLKLDWCEGQVPTPDGLVNLRWRKQGSQYLYHVTVPAGYRVQVTNLTGQELVAQP